MYCENTGNGISKEKSLKPPENVHNKNSDKASNGQERVVQVNGKQYKGYQQYPDKEVCRPEQPLL
jgi:hypothetical protein